MITEQLFVEIDMLKDELAKVKMQRDTLAEAIRNHKKSCQLISSIDKELYQSLAAVKGGQHE